MNLKTNNIISSSPEMKSEYCAQVVRIGELKPIVGSDFLAETLVSGTSMVVRKDEFSTGDLAIYCKNETVLNSEFLSKNNLYDSSEFMRNENYETVIALKNKYLELSARPNKSEEELDEVLQLEARIKSSTGFFNKHGRVKSIKLKGVISYGFLIKLDTLAVWQPSVKNLDLSKYILNEEMGIGMDFDTVCGEKFISVYVPPIKSMPSRNSKKHEKQREKKIERFERISKEDFKFHYDTNQLSSNIWRIQPTDKVFISSKFHGTSTINANIPVKMPIKLSFNQRFWNWCHKKAIKLVNWLANKTTLDYKEDYGNVYSSRGVIKNQFINKNVTSGFYGVDVWGVFNEILKPYIEKGMTIYGEICGYLPNSEEMIQKGYDYGCKKGESFYMPYRITTMQEDGTLKEWEVDEVYNWTLKLINEHSELNSVIKPIRLLYSGTLSELYPEISLQNHWHENVLQALKQDKSFYMEMNEPICKNKVPNEGIVLRIANDPINEAFKLKCDKFYAQERKSIDNGDVDIEMADAY